MRLDVRGFILGTWLTLLLGTLSSTFVLNYYANTRPDAPLPQTVEESVFIILGLWWAALLIPLMIDFLGWEAPLWTSLVSYWLGAFMRLILLGKFLPGGEGEFNIVWQALTFQAFPPYDAFWMLILLGGSAVVGIGSVAGTWLRKPHDLDLTLPTRHLATLIGLSPILMFLIIGVRNISDNTYTDFALLDIHWLILPQANMLLAALLGFWVGGTYLCPNRYAAALMLFVGMAAHVIIMLLAEGVFGSFDPLYEPFDPNRVSLLAYLFWWVGVPVVGAIAAFALHNLRDAFQLPLELDSEEAVS